MKRFLTLGF